MAEHTIKMTCGENVMKTLELIVIPIYIVWVLAFLASFLLLMEEMGNDEVRLRTFPENNSLSTIISVISVNRFPSLFLTYAYLLDADSMRPHKHLRTHKLCRTCNFRNASRGRCYPSACFGGASRSSLLQR